MAAPNPEKQPLPQGEQQLFPPPPPGPPPAQQHPLQAHPLSQTENPTVSYSVPSQNFPPPPPGPPPAHQEQQQQQQYLSQSHPLHQFDPHQQNTSQQNAPQQYTPAPQHPNEKPIPDYNPANPQFAAPPVSYPYNDPPSDDEHRQKQKHSGWGAKLTQMGMKAAGPINALANKMGSQSFLPTTMDKECEKAAQILKSFCKEGVASNSTPAHQTPAHGESAPVASGDRPVTPTKQKKERGAIVKIPPKVLAKAQGLAIFTTARVGFQLSGATGSGILIARLPDGSWSPPSGIQVHAVGAGFMIGVDIYDCVCVINSKDALAAFMSTRVSLGPDVAVVAGPWGAGGTLDVGAGVGGSKKSEEAKAGEGATTAAAVDGAPPKQEVNQTAEDGKLKPDEKGHKRRSSSSALKPVFSYVKSRGFYAGVQVDGTVVTERKDANAAFYGQKLSVQQILRGEVPSHSAAANATHWPAGSKSLYDTLKIAEAQPATAEVHLPTAAQQQTAHVPGAVGVPLEKQDHPVPIHGSGAQMSGAAGTTGEQLPGYVHDGVVRPGVGDNKTTYQ